MSREKRKFDRFPFAVREPEREETTKNNVKRIKVIKFIKKKRKEIQRIVMKEEKRREEKN